MGAMNQSLTDEDATLVLQGLGMYTTDAGPPENPDGSVGAWEIGPGQVVEVGDGQSFSRVTGVSSVAPMQEHLAYMHERMNQAAGVPEVAAGRVDVTVAESGISLKLQMQPIISKNREKEDELLSIMDHLLHDLCSMWFPAYEGVDFSGIDIASQVEDAIPQNRDAKIQEIILLFTSGLITVRMAQSELAKLGYNFADGDEAQAIADAAALAAAKSGDPFANRYAAELEGEDESPPSTPSATGSTPTTPNQAQGQATAPSSTNSTAGGVGQPKANPADLIQ